MHNVYVVYVFGVSLTQARALPSVLLFIKLYVTGWWYLKSERCLIGDGCQYRMFWVWFAPRFTVNFVWIVNFLQKKHTILAPNAHKYTFDVMCRIVLLLPNVELNFKLQTAIYIYSLKIICANFHNITGTCRRNHFSIVSGATFVGHLDSTSGANHNVPAQ